MKPDENKRRHIVVCGKGSGGGSASVDWDDILNKPEFATVATSGDYDDLTDKPTIPEAQVNSDWNAVSGVSEILNKPTLATVATSGDYDDLQNKPTIPAAQVNSDWNSNSGVSQILNKPSLATVATSGNYSDLNGTPSLATVATSGDYDDLQNKPTIPAAPVQSDWNEADSGSLAYIANKPSIPAAQVNADWNAVSGVAQILNKPTIPAAQVNADWNAVSGVAQILNKPSIPAAQVNADWNANSGVAEILNKPVMATETLTFTLQGGTVVSLELYVKPDNSPYFYVEDISGSANTLSIFKIESYAPTVEVFYSTDQQNWTSMGSTSDTPITATIPANGKLYLKANTDSWGESMSDNNMSASGSHNIGGNIMSLLYGDNYRNQTTFPTGSSCNFEGLFNYDTTLVSAENLILPATTLADYCYSGMFINCESLTAAPALPATTLGDYCYQRMFQNCTSLNNVTTYAQDISATDCLTDWLDSVSATGDFYNLGGATYTSGASGIPSGWTEHNSL